MSGWGSLWNTWAIYSKASGEKILCGKTILAEKRSQAIWQCPPATTVYLVMVACAEALVHMLHFMQSGHTGPPDLYWQATCHRLKPRLGESLCVQPRICVTSNNDSERHPLAEEGTQRDAFHPALGQQKSQPVVYEYEFIQSGASSYHAQARSSFSCTGRAGNPCLAMLGSLRGRGHLATTSSEPPLALEQAALPPACDPLCSLQPDIIL